MKNYFRDASEQQISEAVKSEKFQYYPRGKK